MAVAMFFLILCLLWVLFIGDGRSHCAYFFKRTFKSLDYCWQKWAAGKDNLNFYSDVLGDWARKNKGELVLFQPIHLFNTKFVLNERNGG